MRVKTSAYLAPHSSSLPRPAYGPPPIGFRPERPNASVRPALDLDQMACIVGRLPSDLAHDRALIADEPLVIDAVVAGVAVRDDPVPDSSSACSAVGSVAGVGSDGENAVRAEQPFFRGAAPDDVFPEQLAVRELRLGRQGRRNHVLVADDERGGGTHHDVGCVAGTKRSDASLLPDVPGHPQDVVRKVGVLRVESFHESHPFGIRAEVRGTSAAGRQTLRGETPGSTTFERSNFTVSSTIADASWRTVVRS